MVEERRRARAACDLEGNRVGLGCLEHLRNALSFAVVTEWPVGVYPRRLPGSSPHVRIVRAMAIQPVCVCTRAKIRSKLYVCIAAACWGQQKNKSSALPATCGRCGALVSTGAVLPTVTQWARRPDRPRRAQWRVRAMGNLGEYSYSPPSGVSPGFGFRVSLFRGVWVSPFLGFGFRGCRG